MRDRDKDRYTVLFTTVKKKKKEASTNTKIWWKPIKIHQNTLELNPLYTIYHWRYEPAIANFSSIRDHIVILNFLFCPIFIFVLFPLRLLNRRLLQCNVYAFMWGCAPAAGRDRLLCMDLQGFGATASAALLTVYLTVLNMLVHNCPWGERWCLRAFVSIWVWMKTRSTAKIVCSKWMCGEQNSQINH